MYTALRNYWVYFKLKNFLIHFCEKLMCFIPKKCHEMQYGKSKLKLDFPINSPWLFSEFNLGFVFCVYFISFHFIAIVLFYFILLIFILFYFIIFYSEEDLANPFLLLPSRYYCQYVFRKSAKSDYKHKFSLQLDCSAM